MHDLFMKLMQQSLHVVPLPLHSPGSGLHQMQDLELCFCRQNSKHNSNSEVLEAPRQSRRLKAYFCIEPALPCGSTPSYCCRRAVNSACSSEQTLVVIAEPEICYLILKA